MAEKHKLL